MMRLISARSVSTGCCFLILLAACESTQLGRREVGALGGAALGAGLGAIIGHETGHTGGGIAIGSAIGAASGALIGNELDRQQGQLDANQDRLSVQEQQLEENKRLIAELRSRGADVRSTGRGVIVNLPDVLFEFDSARLTRGARATVGEIADVLRAHPERLISVEGHTDSSGTVEYNSRLSEQRARSVASELSMDGVSRKNIRVRGFGESQPVSSNRTEAGRSRNRRVEVMIENQAR